MHNHFTLHQLDRTLDYLQVQSHDAISNASQICATGDEYLEGIREISNTIARLRFKLHQEFQALGETPPEDQALISEALELENSPQDEETDFSKLPHLKDLV